MIDLSYRGEYTEKFEKLLSDYTGIEYVLCTNTGTAALHLAYFTSGIEPGTEVIVPALTFVATANALRYIGAHPNFVDVDDHLGIDITKTKKYLKNIVVKVEDKNYNKITGREITGIVPVHLLGIPVNMDGVLDIAIEYNLRIIEDACQALGSTYKGDHVGAFGDCGALSFNGNKILTTGGGGALLTRKKDLYEKAKHYSMVSRVSENIYDACGWNYRMSAWNALLGISQFEVLPVRLLQNNKKYKTANPIIKARRFTKPNNWKVGVSEGKPLFTPLTEYPMYKLSQKDDLSNAYDMWQRVRVI